MSAPLCGDCLIELDKCQHAVEYITQRRAIKMLRKANEVMSQMFNTDDPEEVIR